MGRTPPVDMAKSWGHATTIPGEFWGVLPGNLPGFGPGDRKRWHRIAEGDWRGNRGERFRGWFFWVDDNRDVHFKREDPFSLAFYDPGGNLDRVDRGAEWEEHRRDLSNREHEKRIRKRARDRKKALQESRRTGRLRAARVWASAVTLGHVGNSPTPPDPSSRCRYLIPEVREQEPAPSGSYMALDSVIEIGGVMDAIAEEFEGRDDLCEILDSATRGLESRRIVDYSPSKQGLGWDPVAPLPGDVGGGSDRQGWSVRQVRPNWDLDFSDH